MKISVQLLITGEEQEPLPLFLAEAARILEQRGIAGVWAAEHVVAFSDYDPKYSYPYSDDGRPPAQLSQAGLVEPLTVLTALALHSTTLRLGTGIAILPQRNPVYFAKTAAALDLLSNGRFIAGIGLGWSGQEYAATNTPFERRGARLNDYIQVIRTLWEDPVSEYHGEFYDLPACIHLPKPVQRPHPPLYFGGESIPAMRRVARFGQGWFAMRMTPDILRPKLAALQDLLAEHGRSPTDVDIVASPGDRECNADMIASFAELGVSEVVVPIFANSVDAFRRDADLIQSGLVEPSTHF
ncbi:LLM class F420-dependent oxidoreductase [Croceicoccus estronivorus]|uniref:LLM class F420-dependent oxidoreductase n=1 Tax=Croceicoccus estronivorus TaxID=1172626 RepID=UPI0014784206|nr:LLM class F420-dependent oxidoreductase [Croceicoccus estronivorus]